METSIKNNELYDTIVQFVGNPQNQNGYGLIYEEITIGTKNRIQKIVKTLQERYLSFNESHVELLKKYGAKEVDGSWKLQEEDQTDSFKAEWKELSEQANSISFDPIDYKKIEDVKVKHIYATTGLLKPFLENI